jgi:hypothetical protein
MSQVLSEQTSDSSAFLNSMCLLKYEVGSVSSIQNWHNLADVVERLSESIS